MKAGISVKGRIASLSVKNKDGFEKETLSFDNHILKNNLLAEGGGMPISLQVLRVYFGTGTAPDSPDFVGLSSPDEIYWGLQVTNYYSKNRYYDPVTRERVNTYVMEYNSKVAGYYAGTWTEMGLGDDASSNFRMTTRTLIKDDTGNPTSITVLDDEYVSVVYEITVAEHFEESTGTLTAGGITYNYKLLNIPYRKDEKIEGSWATNNRYTDAPDTKASLSIKLSPFQNDTAYGIEHFPTISQWENRIADPVWIDNNRGDDEYRSGQVIPASDWVTTITGPQSINFSFSFLPNTTDALIGGMTIGSYITEYNMCIIAFDKTLIKPANEKLTVSLDITWSIQ